MKKRALALFLFFVVLCVAGVDSSQAVIKSWRKILMGPTWSVAVMPSPVPGAPSIILAGTTMGIKKSLNGGVSWTAVSNTNTLSLATDPATPGLVYAATVSGLYKSADYGQTWTLLNAGIKSSVTVSPFNPQVIFGGHLKSVDGGATWYPMVGLPPFATSIATDAMAHIKCSKDPALPGFMLASFGEKSYRSDNSGENWILLKDDIDSVEIDPVDARYYYLGGRCGRSLTRYYPGGSSSSASISHIHALAIDPTDHRRVFAATDGATAVSRDFGQTWQSGGYLSDFYDPPNGRMIFDASNGQVLLPARSGLMVKNSWCVDGDLDGYSPEGGLCGSVDCADATASVNPGVRENCMDGIDNNCSGTPDHEDPFCVALCSDHDQDGHLAFGCPGGDDCWDYEAAVFPGATEVCDGRDNDCNGLFDEDPSFDQDGDFWTFCNGDCNDTNASVYPWALELPSDGTDQDCSGYDLTIRFHRVKYQKIHDYLLVEAESAYGEEAALELDYFGPLAWDANRKLWVGEFTDIMAKPSFITLCGVEGCRDFNLDLSKINWQHEHETLRVEVESAYGDWDSISVDYGSLSWDAVKNLWIGEFPEIDEKPAYINICSLYSGCMMYYLE